MFKMDIYLDRKKMMEDKKVCSYNLNVKNPYAIGDMYENTGFIRDGSSFD